MQEVFEKIIEKLEELQNYACFPTEWVNEEQSKIHSYYANKLTEILKLTEQYNNGWIPCSKRLPKKPAVKAEQNYRLPEYIVTIDGGCESTTLEYAGDGEWHDPLTNCKFKVTAWQPLPAPYQQKGE